MDRSIDHLLRLTACYAQHTGRRETTVSRLATGSGMTIERLRNGAAITTRRLGASFVWLSDHWPEGLEWPADIPRPEANPNREEAA